MQAGAAALGASGLQPPMPRPACRRSSARSACTSRSSSSIRATAATTPARSKNGTVEKNVVLAFSLKLRDKLNATGRYKVLMTRDTRRVRRAERAPRVRRAPPGLAVRGRARRLRAAEGARRHHLLAARVGRQLAAALGQGRGRATTCCRTTSSPPCKHSDGDVGAVREILADLARREVDSNRDRTSVFVKSVIEYMGESTNLKDNPDRSAAFVVIKSAKVPSILIELGYVTNEEDAELLKSDAWREKVSGSIVTAIDNYFSHQLARLPM